MHGDAHRRVADRAERSGALERGAGEGTRPRCGGVPLDSFEMSPMARGISYAFVMKTYSFKRLTLDILDIEKPDFEGKLDAFGSQGWQLVSSFDREKGGNSKEVYFIFMRANGE